VKARPQIYQRAGALDSAGQAREEQRQQQHWHAKYMKIL